MGVIKISTASGIKIARPGVLVAMQEYDILPEDLTDDFVEDESVM